VRGVFSGALKKKIGLAIVATKEERGRIYRIAEVAQRRVRPDRGGVLLMRGSVNRHSPQRADPEKARPRPLRPGNPPGDPGQ